MSDLNRIWQILARPICKAADAGGGDDPPLPYQSQATTRFSLMLHARYPKAVFGICWLRSRPT
jgi:hypothetical protein